MPVFVPAYVMYVRSAPSSAEVAFPNVTKIFIHIPSEPRGLQHYTLQVHVPFNASSCCYQSEGCQCITVALAEDDQSRLSLLPMHLRSHV